MNGLFTGTQRPAVFTYPDEEAMWHADNPDKSANGECHYSTKEYLSFIKEDFKENLIVFKKYLDGEKEVFKWPGLEIKLGFIANPESFEDEISYLSECYNEETLEHGKLSFEDEAWIKNTGKLVEKYNGIYRKIKEEGNGKQN